MGAIVGRRALAPGRSARESEGLGTEPCPGGRPGCAALIPPPALSQSLPPPCDPQPRPGPEAAAGPVPAVSEGDGLGLEPLGPADLEACLELDQRSLGGLWSRQQWLVELAEPARPGSGLRSADGLVAMACGWLVLEELHITLVAVAPERRRRGHGRRVLAHLLGQARGRGAERATLEVAASNAAAQALYRSCGFCTAGIRHRYYRSGEDALIQWARL